MEKENSKERKEPRMLPYNMEAEQSLLGSLFLSKDACMEVFATVKAEDFYSNAHKKIYEAMLDNYKKDVAIDYITITETLSTRGQLEDVGGVSYITDLTNYVPSAANFKYYADIVRNASMLREIIDVSQKVMTKAYENGDAKETLDVAEREIFEIAQTRRTSDLVHIKSSLNEAVSLMEQVSADPNANSGVKVGFPTLDKYTNGFKPGELIILAARPGVGKTAMAVNFAVNAAIKHHKSIAIFDLEMSAMQVAQRLLSSTGRINMEYMKTGTKDNNVWSSLFETKSILENTNIYIDDTTTITPSEILSKCRKRKTQSGLDMVIVDYLQLMKSEQKAGAPKDYNRQQEVSDLTRSFKLAARELNVPIILLSQLNRDSSKQNREPVLSDLRESGSIEQDADIVMFISEKPAENVVPDETDDAEDNSLIIAKHRNGERGTIPVKFKREFTQFYEDGKDTLYTKNKTKLKPDAAVLTAVEDADIDDAFGE